MFDESTGLWSTVRIDGRFYRRGVLTTSASLRKTAAGAFSVLLVGAGGSGNNLTLGGGGGGGRILTVTARDRAVGTYAVTIGAAPTASAARGGDTSAFGLLAEGGSPGSAGDTGYNGGGGNGTGGGGTRTPGGAAKPDGNSGGASFNGALTVRAGGGGGSMAGAGGDAGSGVGGLAGPATWITFAALNLWMAPDGSGAGAVMPGRPQGYQNWGTGGAGNFPSPDTYPAQPGAVVILYPPPHPSTDCMSVTSASAGKRTAVCHRTRRDGMTKTGSAPRPADAAGHGVPRPATA